MAADTEQLKIGSARIEVRVEDWPNGGTGIWVQIGESGYLFTVEGAVRLKEALENQIGLAGELDEIVPRE